MGRLELLRARWLENPPALPQQAWQVPMVATMLWCRLGLRRLPPVGGWTDSSLAESAGVWKRQQFLVWQAGAGRRDC